MVKSLGFTLLALISVLFLYIYNVQIQPMFDYLNFNQVGVSGYFVFCLVFVFLCFYVVDDGSEVFSIFISFLFVFLMLPFFLISASIGLSVFVKLFLFLLLFVVFLWFFLVGRLCRIEVDVFYFDLLKKLRVFDFKKLSISLCICVFVFTFYYLDFDLSYSELYERRLEAREKLVGGFAYIFYMCLNGISPLMCFKGVRDGDFNLFLVGFLFSILSFGFVGTKAPVFYCLLMAVLACYFRFGFRSIINIFLSIFFVVFFLSFIEYQINGYSYLAQVIVRRAFVVPVLIMLNHVDYIVNNYSFWEVLSGGYSNSGITYHIGYEYFGKAENNASTNAFVFELGRNGFLGLQFCVLFITVFLLVSDILYKNTKDDVWCALVFLYSILLVGQSYSVAFISSGIGLAAFILFFQKSRY